MKKLYFECLSGISGDMTVAALIDLGADDVGLREALRRLPLDGYNIVISRVKKNGIDACDFNVLLEHDNHDHDAAYLYGHADEPHEHNHSGDAAHDHHHEHHHRTMADIRNIIENSGLTDDVKKMTLKIFEILAAAEAKAHAVSVDNVHFHEVGAVDSIVDIVSAAYCLVSLGVTDIIVPALYEGSGTVRTQHGILPVPVPAVLNIAETHKIPLSITENRGEYVTPTGAAIVAAVRTEDRLPEKFTVLKTGVGAGKRQQDGSGILRVMLIEENSD